MTLALPEQEQAKKELIVFLALTFAATYLLELIGIGLYGSGVLTSRLMTIPMYIPAVSAIVCMVYFRSAALTKEAKIFLAAFLIASAVSLIEGLYQPLLGTIGPIPVCTAVVSVGAFLVVVIQNLNKPWRESLMPARLSFGRNYRYYLILSVVFFVLFVAGLLFSYYTGLGLPTTGFDLSTFTVFIGITLAFLLVTWPKYFGEEYGWRFYLQDRVLP
ncbi:MAG TPA: hypothetical protein VHN82_02450, partial [Methanoregula sp.]|nr:hypothetical protein [Methanoregula sp.]